MSLDEPLLEPQRDEPDASARWRTTLPTALALLTLIAAYALPSVAHVKMIDDYLIKAVLDTVREYDGHGTLSVRVDGNAHEYKLVALDSTAPALVRTFGSMLSLGNGDNAPDQGTRVWVAHDASGRPDSYVHFELLGKELSYTIDLGGVGCGCNAALYWVSMPGYSSGNTPAPGAFGNYYCERRTFGRHRHLSAHSCLAPSALCAAAVRIHVARLPPCCPQVTRIRWVGSCAGRWTRSKPTCTRCRWHRTRAP